MQTLLPEAMITCDFDEKKNQAMLDWCDVLVIGPVLERSAEQGKSSVVPGEGS